MGAQVTPEVGAHLKEAGVDVKDYDAMLDDVRALAASGSSTCIDPNKVRMMVPGASMVCHNAWLLESACLPITLMIGKKQQCPLKCPAWLMRWRHAERIV